MRRLAMARNFSWTKPAASYESIYARTIDGFQTQRVA
jgi:glycogen synthase